MKVVIRLLLFSVFLFSYTASAQQRKVDGALKTMAGTPVSHASVMLKHSSNRIVVFISSDVNGQFQLVVPDTAKWSDLSIEVNHLGYARVSLPLKENVLTYDVLMEEQAISLAEIKHTSRPRIDSYGDTLSYDVGSFARAEDRSIGDVLKRMPGMEVTESGQIRYNDKPISNFYIDGDDLLDDKYSIGTKTIPHAMVQKLEVMQNHQPLKVLRNRTLSDQIAINLVIKDEAKLKMTGQAKVGVGLPHQYDGELNTILFNKKFKMLNVIKGNNVGDDLNSDLVSIGVRGSSGSRPSPLLSAGVSAPPLPTSRYFLNNSGSLNANNLVNLNSGLQLKSNIRALIDRNDLESRHETEILSVSDTIRFWERQAIRRDPFVTELTLAAESNKDSYFFNNSLKINYRGETGRTTFQSNAEDFTQNLRSRIRDFSNDLRYVPELRNGHILNLSWNLHYYSRPQTLLIEPGLNPDILNGGEEFLRIDQAAEIPSWFNRVALSYQVPRGRIRQSYNLSTSNESQQLQSALRIVHLDATVKPFDGSKDNDLRWRKNDVSMSGNYEYKQGRIEASLSLPLIWQDITYSDAGFDLDKRSSRLQFSPSFRAKMMTTAEDYLSVNYRYGEQAGDIGGIYRGAILTGYRSLRANEAALYESRGHGGSLHYNFQRSISMLFMNAGITFNRTMANSIASIVMTDNISQVVQIPFENNISSFGASAGISKYIFGLAATTSLKGSWSTSRANQLLNGETLPFHNISWTLAPSIAARLWQRVSANYDGVGTWNVSRSALKTSEPSFPELQIYRYDQSVSLGYAPRSHIFFRLVGRHQHISQPNMEDLNYFFMDAKARYTLKKWRTDFDLDLNNLADIRRYETFSLTANQFSHSQYKLRGRMAVLKATFNL